VTINGAALYYEEHGDPAGQPVLLLYGALGSIENWANLAPVLVAAGYRVIATDSRAQGRSAWGDVPITYEQMAADTLGLLDHLGIAKTDVVGWSQGAIIALDLAIHHPERLGRVVAYGAYFSPGGTRFVPSDQIPPFERFIADYRRLSPEPERFEELAGVLDALHKTAPNYSEAELRSISAPVLVLDGEAEEGIKAEHTRQLAALIPGSTLVLMPGTGHFAMFAQPAAFNQIVLDYLAGTTPATPTAGTPTA
jgi:pimeloyl-ACP methyl ester carboxylesterase